jgi:hypothetical protein
MSAIFAGIDIKNKLNDKNEFVFENVFAQDSLKIYFELFDRNNVRKTLKMATQAWNANRKFLKPFAIEVKTCATNSIAISNPIIFPTVASIVDLKEIEIKNKAKQLKNELKFGNSMARGFKITDDLCKQYIDIYSFLQANGFNIVREMGEVLITPVGGGFGIGAVQGNPQIIVDEMLQFDSNNLDIYPFCDIDEIYINRRGMGGGPGSENGVIKIYLKKYTERQPDAGAQQSQALVIKNGFATIRPYKNPAYTDLTSKGFLEFGTVHWIAEVETDKDGNFQFAVPSLFQKTIKVKVEGIDVDGNMISTVQEIKLL